MGRGGDASLIRSGSDRRLQRSASMLDKLQGLQAGLQAKQKMRDLRNDLTVLKNIWFKKLADTDDHAERLEQFYGPQAHACECDVWDPDLKAQSSRAAGGFFSRPSSNSALYSLSFHR